MKKAILLFVVSHLILSVSCASALHDSLPAESISQPSHKKIVAHQNSIMEKKLALIQELLKIEHAQNLENKYKTLVAQLPERVSQETGTLYAPWRHEYDKKKDTDKNVGCPFCYKLSQTIDRENLILKRFKHVSIKLNLYPYTAGHLLVLPHNHVSSFDQLSSDERHELIDVISATITTLKKALGNDFFNAGVNLGGQGAGGSVPDHVHFHVVPRWPGDASFMGPIAGTSIIGKDSLDLFDHLKPYFDNLNI